MGVLNGSQRDKEIKREAVLRYGSELLSTEGVIRAALSEPIISICRPGCKHKKCAHKEDREESRFWDYALVNAIRVMHELDPIESFK